MPYVLELTLVVIDLENICFCSSWRLVVIGISNGVYRPTRMLVTIAELLQCFLLGLSNVAPSHFVLSPLHRSIWS